MRQLPEFTEYDSGLGPEQILHLGRDGDVRLLIIPPLFDEFNKMRRVLVEAMFEAQFKHNIQCFFPDLPGQNESLTLLSHCRLADWEVAIQCAATAVNATHVASIRSACLLDGALSHLPRWRYAPVAGERVVTHMIRAQLAGDKAAGRSTTRADYENDAAGFARSLGGYQIAQGLLNDLRARVPSPLNEGVDRSLDGGLGPALWLRAEPGESAEMSALIAENWGQWASE